MKRVLICDDDDALQAIFRFILRSDQIQVMSLADGTDIVAKVRDFAPDLIILDLMLPVMDGFQVLQALKADPATAAVPVITISGLEKKEYIDGALNLGAAEYLVKPINPAQAKAIFYRHLGLGG